MLAVLLGLGATELLLWHCRQRFGRVTGELFGGLTETVKLVTVVVLALG